MKATFSPQCKKVFS